jgi:hypothetical protein
VNALEPVQAGPEFFRRAEAESRRYGGDAWVFFRELGQNSRDAFASRIDVFVRMSAPEATLAFADDGRGMTFDHARRYLFRLYASSKDRDPLAAGRYGVGFWSVLRFGPARLEVHSRTARTGGEAWGVCLSGDLSGWKTVECRRKRPGTTIVLAKDIEPGQEPEMLRMLEKRLAHYLSHLRTAGRSPKPLRVFLDGRRIHRPFRLDGPGALAFKDGDVEGVVGFGSRPSYRLYARGLPVTSGAYLEELEGKRIRDGAGDEREGAAPVYLLNGNNLDVVLSRRTVLKDKALQRLVNAARRRFDELVSRTIDGAVRRSWVRRIGDALGDFYRKAEHSPAWVRWCLFLMTIFLLGGTLGILVSGLGPRAAPRAGAGGDLPVVNGPSNVSAEPGPVYTPALRPEQWRRLHTGTVDAAGIEPSWALSYDPPQDLMFRLLTLDRYDIREGWQPADPGGEWLPLESGRGKKRSSVDIRVEMAHDRKGGVLLLPVPSGYAPVGGSGRAGKQPVALQFNRAGLVRVRLPRQAPSPLRFWIRKNRGWGAGGLSSRSLGVELPAQLEDKLAAIRELPLEIRTRRVLKLIRSRVRYDRSPEIAGAYLQRFGRSEASWPERVLAVGAGDCDVINGLLVLMLRKVGVPARLVVGVVGRNGEALPGTHAWAEVEQGGIVVVDATTSVDPIPSGTEPERGAARAGEAQALSFQDLLFLVGAAIITAALSLLAWGVWRSSRGRTRLEITEDARLKRGLVASMAADALRRPGAWMSIPGLWHRPFIPCLGGRFLSLARAVRLAYRDQLFIGRRGGPLELEAVRCRARVLDRGAKDFADMFASLSNLRDLEELAGLKPVSPPQGPAGELLREVNRLLRRSGAGIPCRAVEGRENGLCRDVDLSPIRPRRRSGWSRRYLAVFCEDPWWQRIAKLHRAAPRLAASIAVDRLVDESSLLRPKSGPLRRLAANLALQRRP